jgi:hypothetical protein
MYVWKKEYEAVHALRSQVHHAAGVFSAYLSAEYNEVLLGIISLTKWQMA